MRASKPPVWREGEEGGVWHSRPVWRARVNGWRLTVQESRNGDKPLGVWILFAEHPASDRVFNSAWTEYQRAWRSREGAQAAAEKGAREGWEFLRRIVHGTP